jgi:hypothetical protein
VLCTGSSSRSPNESIASPPWPPKRPDYPSAAGS